MYAIRLKALTMRWIKLQIYGMINGKVCLVKYLWQNVVGYTEVHYKPECDDVPTKQLL